MKKNELQIGDRVPIFRILGKSNTKGQDNGLSTDGKCGHPIINGEHKYQRLFIKRICWEYYQGKVEDGELWEVEFDNCNEEDYEWYMTNCSNPNFGNENIF